MASTGGILPYDVRGSRLRDIDGSALSLADSSRQQRFAPPHSFLTGVRPAIFHVSKRFTSGEHATCGGNGRSAASGSTA